MKGSGGGCALLVPPYLHLPLLGGTEQGQVVWPAALLGLLVPVEELLLQPCAQGWGQHQDDTTTSPPSLPPHLPTAATRAPIAPPPTPPDLQPNHHHLTPVPPPTSPHPQSLSLLTSVLAMQFEALAVEVLLGEVLDLQQPLHDLKHRPIQQSQRQVAQRRVGQALLAGAAGTQRGRG